MSLDATISNFSFFSPNEYKNRTESANYIKFLDGQFTTLYQHLASHEGREILEVDSESKLFLNPYFNGPHLVVAASNEIIQIRDIELDLDVAYLDLDLFHSTVQSYTRQHIEQAFAYGEIESIDLINGEPTKKDFKKPISDSWVKPREIRIHEEYYEKIKQNPIGAQNTLLRTARKLRPDLKGNYSIITDIKPHLKSIILENMSDIGNPQGILRTRKSKLGLYNKIKPFLWDKDLAGIAQVVRYSDPFRKGILSKKEMLLNPDLELNKIRAMEELQIPVPKSKVKMRTEVVQAILFDQRLVRYFT